MLQNQLQFRYILKLLLEKLQCFRISSFTPKKHPCFRFGSSRATASNSSHNSFHAPDSVLVKQQLPVHFRRVLMLLIPLQLSCSIVTYSSSLQKSLHFPDSVPLALILNEFLPKEKSLHVSDSAPVEQHPPILLTTASILQNQLNNSFRFTTEEFLCSLFYSSITTNSNSSQKSFCAPDSAVKSLHAPDFAPVEQQLPTHDRRAFMLQIQLQYSSFQESVYTSNYASVKQQPPISSTTASMLQIQLNNSLQFAPKESPPVSFSLSPLQKSSYASDSAPVEQQFSTLTEGLPCFRLNCSITTSSSSLQRSFNVSDSVPVEQQPPKQQQ
uniref:Uncharacterized protein n=1 Tax=Strongyloides stercoralis TaxID=6248 RepID=A0AAF5DDI8_STRER